MKIISIIILICSGIYFIYLSAKETQKEIWIPLAMIAAYLMFEGIKKLVHLMKKA